MKKLMLVAFMIVMTSLAQAADKEASPQPIMIREPVGNLR